MKKIIVGVCILAISVAVFGAAAAQEKQQEKQQEKRKISEKFLTTWQKVGNKTTEIRSFKTEKATTVAGVRGAEAEDEALKYLYFKGGVRYPSRMELKNAIDMLEAFVRDNPDDATVPETEYFIAQCYEQLGENDKAIQVYNGIVTAHPASEFAGYAREELERLKR